MKRINILTTLVAAVAFGTAQAGTITGKVNFKGTAPKMEKIKMNADPACKNANKADVLGESVVVNTNGTLKFSYVYLKSGPGIDGKSFPTPTAPATFDQEGCHYAPHVLGVMVSQPIEIKNSDPTLHNVHAMPKNSAQFNLGMPIQNMKMTRKFDKAEVMVKIKCDVHPWMGAWVGVSPHPFFAVTDDKGSFEIKGVPAGKYVVEAWQEKYGTKEQTVTVTDAAAATTDFTFEAPAQAAQAK